MRVARQAARYRLQAEDAANRPYWMYDAINDRRTRAAHAALDNKVYRHDDPFWDTHYPPNGFNCRCRVRALTAQEVQARGLAVSDSRGKLHRVQQHVGVDKRTGEIITRPGMELRDGHIRMAPDAGWSYNPGKEGSGMQFDPDAIPAPVSPTGGVLTGAALIGAIALAAKPVAPVPDQGKTWRDYGEPERLPLGAARPARLDPTAPREAQIQQLRRVMDAYKVAPLTITRNDGKADEIWYRVPTPTGEVAIIRSFFDHTTQDGHREIFANFILPTLQDPAEIWRQLAIMRSGKAKLDQVYLASYPDTDLMTMVREDSKHGGLAWTFYPKDHINTLRQGELLYTRDRGVFK